MPASKSLAADTKEGGNRHSSRWNECPHAQQSVILNKPLFKKDSKPTPWTDSDIAKR